MPKIRKVVSTVWYNKENYHALRAKDADVAILLGDVDDCLLGQNTLKWVACDHAGLNGSARDEVFAKDFIVTGAAGRSAPVLAEHAVYFMLQHCYHTKELLAAQAAGHWGVDGSNTWKGLYGRKAGIVGMGNNGRMLAERLHAFGMDIYAFDKFHVRGMDYIRHRFAGSDGDSIDTLLAECDFIILTLALTDETYHMFDAEAFRKMKKDAFLINIARGGIVDTNALLEALRSGEIGGAGLEIILSGPCRRFISRRIQRRRSRTGRSVRLKLSGKTNAASKPVSRC